MKGVSKYTYKASVCQTFSLMSLIKKCIEMITNTSFLKYKSQDTINTHRKQHHKPLRIIIMAYVCHVVKKWMTTKLMF